MSQKHKTLRSFYCEDSLWDTFEVLTRDLDCSMDYLINEAIRGYSQSRSRAGGAPPSPRGGHGGYEQAPKFGPAAAPPGQPPGRPRLAGPAPNVQDNRTVPLSGLQGHNSPGGPSGFAPAQARPTAPHMPPPPRHSSPQSPRQNPGHRPPIQPPIQPAAPRPPQYGQPQAPQSPGWEAAGSQQPPLYLYFNGQRYVINKERFVVGRGSQGTDLTIRDGNISRKHAAVIFHERTYFIQDLGSTNGVEFRGGKVDSKRVEEGDLFNICDYELRFSYQG